MSGFSEDFWESVERLSQEAGQDASVDTSWIHITPAEAFDLLALAAGVDDRTSDEQATLDRLAKALEERA